MKKLLAILGAIGMTASAGATVVACSKKDDGEKPEAKYDFTIETNQSITKIKVGENLDISIKDFKDIKDKENWKVVIENQSIKEATFDENFETEDKVATISEIKNGVATLTAESEGKITFHFTANKLSDDTPIDDEKPKEPDFKSNSLTIEVLAEDSKLENIGDYIKGKENLGKVKDVEEASEKAKALIDGIKKIKDLVKIGEPVLNKEETAGTITVELKEETEGWSGDKVDLIFTIRQDEIVKKSIDSIKINDVIAGDKKSNVADKILKAIQQEVDSQQVTEGDYDITGLNETVTAKDEIIVTAKESSKLIEGSFTIIVKQDSSQKMALSDYFNKAETELGSWHDKLEVSAALWTTINKKQLLYDVDQPKIEENEGFVLLKAKPSSEKYKGVVKLTFDLNAKPVVQDIANILKGKLNLGDVESKGEAEFKMLEILSDAGLANKHIKTNEGNGWIEITAANDPLLSGTAIFVYKISIPWVPIDPIDPIDIGKIFENTSRFLGYFDEETATKDAFNKVEQIVKEFPELEGKVFIGGNPYTKQIVVTPTTPIIIGGPIVFIYDLYTVDDVKVDNSDLTIPQSGGIFLRKVEHINQLKNMKVTVNNDDGAKDYLNAGIGLDNSALVISSLKDGGFIEDHKGTITISAENLKESIVINFVIEGKFKGEDISGQENSWGLDAYADDHKIWIYNKGIKIDEDGIIQSVKLTDREWSELLWTGMLCNADWLGNANGLKMFNEKELWKGLHFTGNPNKILTNELKGKNISDLKQKDKTIINLVGKNLGITLDADVISKTGDDHKDYGLIHGQVTFNNLIINWQF